MDLEGITQILNKIYSIEKFEQKVQERYASYFLKANNIISNFSEVESLRELTGIEPSQEVLYMGFLEGLKEIYSEIDANKMKKVGTNLDIKEEDIEKIYSELITKGDYSKIGRIKEVTGIEPKFEEDVVQEYYNNQLHDL